MYEFIKMLEIKNIHPCQIATIFKEIDGMYEVKKLSVPTMTRAIFLCWKNSFANGNQRATYAKVLHFRQFCQYMCHMGFDLFIPPIPTRPKTSYIPHIYSQEDIAMFFNTIDSSVLQTHHMTTCLICIPAILRFLYYCGARVGETIEIKNEDVNMEKGYVLLKKTKNRQHRLIPLNESMKSVLVTYIGYRNRMPIKDMKIHPPFCSSIILER
jgi:site-specific recombinase XerD